MINYGEYIWNVHVFTSFSNIESKVFCISKLLWKLQLLPTGMDPTGMDHEHDGLFQIKLKLLTFPPWWKCITYVVVIACKQSLSKTTNVTYFTKDHTKLLLAINILTLQQLKELNLQNLTFNIQINLLNIELEHYTLYQCKWFHTYNKNLKFKWNIKNKLLNKMKIAKCGQRFESKIIDQMWYLSCFPNGCYDKIKNDVVLSLNSYLLPANISKLKIQFKLCCLQENIIDDNIW
eukprot:448155_1